MTHFLCSAFSLRNSCFRPILHFSTDRKTGVYTFLQPLDPTKGRMPFKKIQARELICTSCDDEKASKVCFEPCGHWIEVVCVGKCNLVSYYLKTQLT